MPPNQRTILYYLAIAAAVVLVIAGLCYYGGILIASGQHTKRALACLGLAVLAVVLAFLMRPGSQPAY